MKMVSASYKSFLLAICIVFAGQTSAEDEFFTATAEMEQLLKVLDVLIPSLKQFITDQESKLSSLQKYKHFSLVLHEIFYNHPRYADKLTTMSRTMKLPRKISRPIWQIRLMLF